MSNIHSDKKLPIFSNTDFNQLTHVCSKNSLTITDIIALWLPFGHLLKFSRFIFE